MRSAEKKPPSIRRELILIPCDSMISRSLDTMSRIVLFMTGIAAITKRIPFTTIEAVAYSYA